MKSLLFSLLALASIQAFSAGPARVYMLEGYFHPRHYATYDGAVENVQRDMQAHYPDAKFIATHNSKDKEICDELNALSPKDYPKKLVIIGHSYGGSASMNLARCLGDRRIDLIVSIDSVQRAGDAIGSVVPKNVLRVSNFYENQSSFLIYHGKQKYVRDDGSTSGITNEHVKVGDGPDGPHYTIVTKLVDEKKVFDLVDETLQRSSTSSVISATESAAGTK